MTIPYNFILSVWGIFLDLFICSKYSPAGIFVKNQTKYFKFERRFCRKRDNSYSTYVIINSFFFFLNRTYVITLIQLI